VYEWTLEKRHAPGVRNYERPYLHTKAMRSENLIEYSIKMRVGQAQSELITG